MHLFSWEILIAAWWKKPPKAVWKIPNEAGKELKKLCLANVQIIAPIRDFSLKCYLDVQFPLLSLKVHLVFIHRHDIYFIMKHANKQTNNTIQDFYLTRKRFT